MSNTLSVCETLNLESVVDASLFSIIGSCELRSLYIGCGRSSNRDPGARASDSLSLKDHEGGLLLFVYANSIQLLAVI